MNHQLFYIKTPSGYVTNVIQGGYYRLGEKKNASYFTKDISAETAKRISFKKKDLIFEEIPKSDLNRMGRNQ